ncbi:MAG: hydroxylamine oxidoreductase [Planctomycetes bacterium]|nr:hydroxylamine oxidoreductase [Planctomycetota bacterium]
MSLTFKRYLIGFLGFLFLLSLVFVQWTEVQRREHESTRRPKQATVPASSTGCVQCHQNLTPGIIEHWNGSTHAAKGVGCVECHQAEQGDVDGFLHEGAYIATMPTPRDCARCHPKESEEFQRSHHAAAGNILASLDNFLAEKVEGGVSKDNQSKIFNPHAPTPGRPDIREVNGMASAFVGCQQCHGSKVALQSSDGKMITVDDLKPGPDGKPTDLAAVGRVIKNASGKPLFHDGTWPNTGIGRINLDGSRGSCSACHSRHDFSPRRARRPENCGKCHLGPDHPQKEIYEESKHGIAYRDKEDDMNLDAATWVLGQDYSAAPTCATCHMSAHSKGGSVTHDPGTRISWTNRPPVSQWLDTDIHGKVVTETDPAKRASLVAKKAEDKRAAMKQVCLHCHTQDYVDSFYKQYDDFVVLYNEKFAKPCQDLVQLMTKGGLLTATQFDEELEWTWFYLWHHEGRRARHGASMMAPDYAHWHGMYEVAERFYMEFVPQARAVIAEGKTNGKAEAAADAERLLDEILARPEHQWREKR